MTPYHRDHLTDIRVFVEVSRLESFNRAAEALAATNSAVSKAIRRLEEALGTRLLLRTTRRVSLTEEGRSYLQDCQGILRDIDVATDAVVQRKGAPGGLVRVQLPPLWGREKVVPLLPEFMKAYPKIDLQIIISDRRLDPVDDHVDLIVRVGTLKEAGWVAKRLMPNRALIVAAPKYLDGAPLLKTPHDLLAHTCINYMVQGSFRPAPWVFTHAGKTTRRVFESQLMFNDPAAMREAALAGMGVVQGPDFLFAESLQDGALRQVLNDWEAAGPTITLVWRQDFFMPHRVRVFIDWLLKVVH
jgi:LysR family transcriptional regulator, regulator for bpeEF and oprC